MKPEPKIYLEAAKMANVAPSEIFFMDDRPENVEGARAVGIDAVLFQSVDQLHRDLFERKLPMNT
jgi:glucose-1-phosphatase